METVVKEEIRVGKGLSEFNGYSLTRMAISLVFASIP
jgi:hypothetical protein